ncbi:MAG: hypothetical protein MUQ30_02825, partial [Anaerolineae bacterium]|nr:hypothetical protein [Anaerolineae bacterium]
VAVSGQVALVDYGGCSDLAALDGDFAAFQDRVLGLRLEASGLDVAYGSLRGDTLTFGWQVPLLRNGQEKLLRFSWDYENPYCILYRALSFSNWERH